MTAAEDALRTSEELLGLLMQYSRDAVASLDASTTITWISPVIEDLSGWKPEELIGRSAFELVHPDDLERGLRVAAEAFETGIGVDPVTLRFTTASGDWLPLEISAGTVHDAAGDVVSIIVNLRDVSWRLEAEDALRRSERWFRALVQHSADAIMVIDESATVTYASPAVETVFGRPSDEIVGTSGIEFLHPDDRELVVGKLTEVFAAPGATERVEVRVQGGFEGWHWIEARAVNLADDDAVRGVVIHVRDITERLLSSQALAESEDRFKALLEHSTDVIVVTDREANVIYASPAIEHLFGRTAEEVFGRQAGRLVHPDDIENVRSGTVEVYATPGLSASLQLRVLDSLGRWRWIEANYTNLTHDARVGGVVVHIRDITDSRSALRESQRLTTIFEATNDIVGIADPQGELLYLNAAARRFFGLPDGDPEDGDDVTGFNLVQAFPPNVAERVSTEVSSELEAEDKWNGELALIRGDGQLVPMLAQLLVHRDADGAIEYFSGVLHDISERKQFESALAHQATHDPLTGLPNRLLLLDRLEGALARAKRHGYRVAVLFLDLDHFKVVNDSLGHELGDRLLVAIAERLQVALRPGDTIARFGGDEFVVLCEDLHGRNDAVAIAERVISAVSGPFVVDDAEVFVGLSIGIAFPAEDAEPGTLIRDADAAMYRAKERGRGRWEVFDNDLRASAVDRLDIENALRRSLDRRELRVYYQPIVQLDTGAISGVEALLRWEHSERGLLLPGDFIGIAEETGLIVPIGMWVLDQACRQIQRWQASIPAIPKLTVSVNLSGRQLGHPMLVDDVAAVLADTGLSPERLELEITESVLMDDVEASEETLRELDELGVRLVVDDFGTGYSSLSYLRRFPVDLLKVDREFVDGLHSDASDSAIVTAIVTLAHTLGMEAVAEGVETPEQLEELRSVGCDKAQGFLIAKPSAGDDIAELLEARPYW